MLVKKHVDGVDLVELDDEERAALRTILLEMLDDVLEVCRRRGLSCFLAGGSMLGAARHHGFIPWDDDLDVFMPRKDYDAFEAIFDRELSEKYYLQSVNRDHYGSFPFSKIIKKNTTWLEAHTSGHSYNGVYLDIFPLENAPAGGWARKEYVLGCKALTFVVVSLAGFLDATPAYRAFLKENYSSKKVYYLRRITAGLLGWMGLKRWLLWMDRFASRYKNRPDLPELCCPTGRGGVEREHWPRAVMESHGTLPFEGRDVPVPDGWDTYLRTLYGDYMQLPPENKRERHLIVHCDFTRGWEDENG